MSAAGTSARTEFASPRTGARRAHRAAIGAYLILLAAVAGLTLYPIRDQPIRIAILGGLFALWAGALFLFWKALAMRLLCLCLAAAVAVLVLLPNRVIPPDGLQKAYVTALQSYRGTPYLWGGETHAGIDCSGLVRAGLIDAEFREGWRTDNFVLLRKALSLWWNDSSAAALGEGYQGRTIPLFAVPDLNHAGYARLKPGDLAILNGGEHIMAYLGDATWIEAEPGKEHAVITLHAPARSVWLRTPARLVRWRILDSTPAARAVEPE